MGEREEKLSSQIFHIFAEKSLQSLSNVATSKLPTYGTNCTGDILTSAESCVRKVSQQIKISEQNVAPTINHLSTIQSEISWLKIMGYS